MNALLAAETPLPQLGPGFLADPYPTYRAWRDAGPIHWRTEFAGGACIVTRHLKARRANEIASPGFSTRSQSWTRSSLNLSSVQPTNAFNLAL